MAITTKTSDEIPEVRAFEEAKEELEQFKAVHENVFEVYAQYVEIYNTRRQAAEKAVRGQEVSCGDFDLYQQVRKTSGENVLNALGREMFIKIGGTVLNKSDAKISAAQLKTALGRGDITQELYDEVVTIEQRYHAPKEISQ